MLNSWPCIHTDGVIVELTDTPETPPNPSLDFHLLRHPRLIGMGRHTLRLVLCLLWQRELALETLEQQLPNGVLVTIVRVQWIGRTRVTMPKRGTREPLRIGLVDDPVLRTLVCTPGPLLDHVSAVDDQDVFDGWHWQPLLRLRILHLKTCFGRLLKQDRHPAEVGVGPHPELAGFGQAGRWVADHFHLHNGTLGKVVEKIRRVAETLQQDGPDDSAKNRSPLVVFPDEAAAFFFRKVRPDIGAVKPWWLQDWILPPNVEGLGKVSAYGTGGQGMS